MIQCHNFSSPTTSIGSVGNSFVESDHQKCLSMAYIKVPFYTKHTSFPKLESHMIVTTFSSNISQNEPHWLLQ